MEAHAMETYFVDQAQGEITALGSIAMRLLVPSMAAHGTFSAAEFRGSEGPWTIPHVHHHLEESFYVLEGTFTFRCGDHIMEAKRGAFVMVPRDTTHVISAAPGGGALLAIWTPGGLEEMFIELGRLPAESITDPKVRGEIAQRHDSVPV
jgi:mannose-6-phosphate isomerase-like protein (cupin superfamily)